MDKFKIKLYKCFQILDENFFKDYKENINKRIAFQKYGLFFGQIFGLNINSYSLYIHGPYNSSLANYGYEFCGNIQEYDDEAKKIEFGLKAKEIIGCFKDRLPVNNTDLLEVYSTYFYLLNKRGMGENQAAEEAYQRKIELFMANPALDIEKIKIMHKEIRNQINGLLGKPFVS